VLFLGKRPDIAELYQAMDLFVLPSLFEGLPFVLFEAQTSGLRCLVSNTTSLEAAVTANIQFLPLDKDLWKHRIIESVYSESNRCDNSAMVAAAGYSINKQIRILERIYAGEER